jgi:hypothetical protein
MAINLLDLMIMTIRFYMESGNLNSRKIFIIMYLSTFHILFLYFYNDVPSYLTFCRVHL